VEQTVSKLELKDGTLYELDLNKYYIIMFDKRNVSKADAYQFITAINEHAYKNDKVGNIRFAYVADGEPDEYITIEELKKEADA
jgi:hypothetical protein